MTLNKEKTKNYREYLTNLAAQIENPKEGFFGSNSLAWEINREGILGLGALRALLMQITHPKVAQGIAEHSNYKTQPLSRVYHTLKAQQLIVFGTCDEAIDILVRMYARHNAVTGRLPDSSDEIYSGNDSHLQLWVLGTLVDTVVRGQALFLEPLSESKKEQFYNESKWFAQLMGIPDHILPPTLADFNQWMTSMIDGEEISISLEAQDIAQSLLRLPLPIFWPANYILAVGMLPSKIREGYGLAWHGMIH